MFRKIMLLSVAVAAIGFASEVNAAILGYASGNTNPGESDGSKVDGTINFAVFSKSGAAGDVFGTGIVGFDTVLSNAFGPNALASNYLYLYQIVNDGPNNITIGRFTAEVYAGVDSWGELTGYSFFDIDGEVGASNPLGSPAAHSNPDAENVGVINGRVDIATSGISSLNINGQPYSGDPLDPGNFEVEDFGAVNQELAPAAKTYLVGYTSNFGPALVNASIIDGTTAMGIVASASNGLNGAPAVLPEPGMMAMWGLGLAMFGGVGYLRKRQQKVAA